MLSVFTLSRCDPATSMPSCCHAQQLGENPIDRRFAHVQPFADLSLPFATTPPLRCNHESQPRRETSVNQLHHETPRESHMRLAGKRRAGMKKKRQLWNIPTSRRGQRGGMIMLKLAGGIGTGRQLRGPHRRILRPPCEHLAGIL